MSDATFINEFNDTMERTEQALAKLIQRPNQLIPEIDRLSDKLRGVRAVIALFKDKLATINDHREFDALRHEHFETLVDGAPNDSYAAGVALAWSKIEGIAYTFLPTANEA